MTAEQRAALGRRIRVLVEAAGTQGEAAAVADVSVQQLGRFMRATNAPSLLPLARLAARTGVSLDWVALGRGPQRVSGETVEPVVTVAPLDRDLLAELLDAIARVYREESVSSDPDLGRIVADEYEIIVLGANDARERSAGVRMATERIRRSLREQEGSGRSRVVRRA